MRFKCDLSEEDRQFIETLSILFMRFINYVYQLTNANGKLSILFMRFLEFKPLR